MELRSPSNRVSCKMIRQQARLLFSAKNVHASSTVQVSLVLAASLLR